MNNDSIKVSISVFVIRPSFVHYGFSLHSLSHLWYLYIWPSGGINLAQPSIPQFNARPPYKKRTEDDSSTSNVTPVTRINWIKPSVALAFQRVLTWKTEVSTRGKLTCAKVSRCKYARQQLRSQTWRIYTYKHKLCVKNTPTPSNTNKHHQTVQRKYFIVIFLNLWFHLFI